MHLRIHPEAEAEAGGGTSGFTPSDEELQSAIDAEGETEGEEKAADATPAPESFEFAGKKYTRAEVEELLTRGTLRLEDYSRDKNRLAEERRAFEEERRASSQPPRRDESPEEDDSDQPMTRGEMREYLRQQETKQEMRGLNDLYDQTFGKLCTQHGITDPEIREMYGAFIEGKNPEIDNPKQLIEQVTQLFGTFHERMGKAGKAAVDAEHTTLKKSPKVPSMKGQGAAPMTPAEKPKKSFNDPITKEEWSDSLNG